MVDLFLQIKEKVVRFRFYSILNLFLFAALSAPAVSLTLSCLGKF